MEFSDNENRKLKIELRYSTFEQADAKLKSVFLFYPDPGKMDACPCCVDPIGKRAITIDDFSTYLRRAMTTWGNENDFKYHLPILFHQFYVISADQDDQFYLSIKLNDVREWKPAELEAISIWYSAFSQYYLLNNYIECLLKWRQEVQNWLEGHIEKLDGPFPFNIYNNFFIKEVLRFCDPSMFEFTINPLNLWPMNYNDYLALAACIKNYNFFLHDRQGKLETGIFNPEKVCAWISKHMKSMEKLFFESSNPKAQQLLSDAMGVII